MDDEDLLNLTYRRVYEHTRRRLERLYTADTLAGLTVNPLTLALPEAPDVIVEDAIAGRRPRW